jgi:tetratricopeptide (TPR) repeat protein
LIDDVEVRRDGDDAVVAVRFVTPVRFTRNVSPRANDLTQVFYEVIDARGVANLLQSGQRRLAGGNGLPALSITDELDSGSNKRKLVVRFAGETSFKVRAGRTNRSIDIVLTGQGGAVRPALPTPPMPTAVAGRQYVVLLTSSADPAMQLNAAVPAALQEYQIVTSRRVVDGKTLYEVSLGYFGTAQEASRAVEMLVKRFPQAAVVALAAPADSGRNTAAAPAASASAPNAAVPLAAAPTASAPLAVVPIDPAAANVVVDFDAQGRDLLQRARAEQTAGNLVVAIETLNKLLNLPPNRASREGLELIGLVRLQTGDNERARSELELFLKLYPAGADSDRVRGRLAALPAVAPAGRTATAVPSTTTTSGSVGVTYYGGKSKIRTQDFQDSPISGLPELVDRPTISSTDQKQLVTTTDLNWRHRDADQDVRFVVRDNYTADFMPGKPDKNRLSALYVDYKSMLRGTSIRLGRQSPLGGGVLGRFDGVSGGYSFAPKWKVNLVGGVPTDKLLDTKRRFWGASVDAEALTAHLSGSLYTMQQTIDGLVDRRAVGTDLRYFNGGLAVSGSLDYDVLMKGLNIASVQGNWQLADTSNWNFLFDRRNQPMLMLGNALFFTDPSRTGPPLTSVRQLLDEPNSDLAALRRSVAALTARSTQAQLGYTTPISKNWQAGGNVQLTNVSAIDPVPIILPTGQPATGNQWSLGGQLIGSNLYSVRDTHVFNLSYITSPTLKGYLATYNNLSALNDFWQVEPSMQFSVLNGTGERTRRLKPGLRVTYRLATQLALESSFDYEISRQTGTNGNVNSNLMFYYFGGRYDF